MILISSVNARANCVCPDLTGTYKHIEKDDGTEMFITLKNNACDSVSLGTEVRMGRKSIMKMKPLPQHIGNYSKDGIDYSASFQGNGFKESAVYKTKNEVGLVKLVNEFLKTNDGITMIQEKTFSSGKVDKQVVDLKKI